MSRKQVTVIDAAIAANLATLAQRLEEATTVAREASRAKRRARWRTPA